MVSIAHRPRITELRAAAEVARNSVGIVTFGDLSNGLDLAIARAVNLMYLRQSCEPMKMS